jgi:hypothetical protein
VSREEFEKYHRHWIAEQLKQKGEYPDCAENAAWAFEWLTKYKHDDE